MSRMDDTSNETELKSFNNSVCILFWVC